MVGPLRRTMVMLGCLLYVSLLAAPAHGGDSVAGSWSPGEAAKYLDGRADWWLKWNSAARGQDTVCISCHTTFPYAMARAALGQKLGDKSVGPLERSLMDNLKKRVENWDKIVADPSPGKNPFVPFYANKMKPSALGTEAVLNALVLVNYDARWEKGVLSEPTKKALGHLWHQQKENGAWLWLDFGLNPWETDGTYYGASLAALAVGTAGKDYYEQTEVQAKVAVLKKYLTTQFPNQRLHHRAVALWASSKLPGFLAEQDKKNLIGELLAIQEPDGGWSLPRLGKNAVKKADWRSQGGSQESVVSDGYATGLVVLALKSAGVPREDPKLGKAVSWLNSRQKDGRWPAIYVNKSRDPETHIGKFMIDSATAFATLALADSK